MLSTMMIMCMEKKVCGETFMVILRPEEFTSQRSPSGQGNLYRSAPIKATQDKDSAAVYAPNQRGQRCIRCGSGATGSNSYYGNSADRFSYGREDRNWYYQPERYNDDRYRYGSYNDRYDDRYYSRTMDPLYDTYYNDQRPAYNPNYNNYNYNNNYNARGNGYDNINPAFYEQMRERFNRDRNNYGYERGYENTRGYPAQVYRGMEGGYYDNRNYRPYDETYRGQSGFDNSGRGYYWANDREQQPQPQSQHQQQHHQQEKPYREYQQSTANRHHSYSQAQKPQQNNPNYYNSNNNNNNNAQHHTSSGIAPEYYQVKQSHNTPSNVQTVSSNAIGVDTSGNGNANSSDRWSNKDNKDSNDNSKDLDKEKASPSYGVRPQSLGTSYLYDRNNDGINDGSPASVPAANAAVSANDDKKQESANMQMKEE
ncbi:unnamed protein product [Diamesa hyperborea]